MRSAQCPSRWILVIAFALLAHGGAASGNDGRDASETQPTNAQTTQKSPNPSTTTATTATTAAVENTKNSALSHLVYVPPRRGEPRARISGAVRGSSAKLPTPQALVPDHVAHTARSQPTLLWNLDGPLPEAVAIMFSLTSEQAIEPMVAAVLEQPARAGLQRIHLANYGIHLETGRIYQWTVALVPDNERRSRDLVTFGWIVKIETPEGLGADAVTLAAAGLWYDAIDIADQSEREALLSQVGLGSSQVP